jgi:hypothetical protein
MTPDIAWVGAATVRATVVEWVSAPLVPVRVIVDVPAGVFPATRTSTVEAPLPLIDAGVKVADAFEGNPVADRPTDPENPLTPLTVTEYVVALPCVTLRLPGVADRVKSGTGAAFTASVTVLVRVWFPLMPVIVSVELPAGVLLEVVTFNVASPAPATEAGVKVALALAGSPDTDRSTVSANPFSAAIVAVYDVPAPCVNVRELGVADIEKSGPGGDCDAVGMIWTAFTGARRVPEVPTGVAVSVNPPATMLNLT